MTNHEQTHPATHHTPEPWDYAGCTTMYATPDAADEITMIEIRANVSDSGWDTVAFSEAIWPSSRANARRIVAAINASQGIPTEALEHGVVAALVAAVKEVLAEIEYVHSDMLSAEERSHPRGSGWARVYDRCLSAIALATSPHKHEPEKEPPMTNAPTEISEDEFDARYPLMANHLNPDASWTYFDGPGCLFETYGQELAFVRQQDARTVWTLTDGDDGNQHLVSGFHFVNRIGYLVSKVPVPDGIDIQVRIPACQLS